jgi:hypothetical protein
MIILLIGLAVWGAIVNHGGALFVPAVANAVIAFWGNGVMANFRDAPMLAPNLATIASMVTAPLSVLFIVLGYIA